MNRFTATFTLVFALSVIGFSTWQLFAGNLEAAFSALPFLVITYFFIKPWKKGGADEQQGRQQGSGD